MVLKLKTESNPREKAKDCTHPFVGKVDNHNCGTCSLCGARLQYDWDGKKPPVVLAPGISLTAGDPKELPVETKKAIARAAKEHGVKLIVSKTGLEMKVVRAWIGAYCRDPSKKGGRPRQKRLAVAEELMTRANELLTRANELLLVPYVVRLHGRYSIYSF